MDYERPEELRGVTTRLRVACPCGDGSVAQAKVFATLNYDGERMVEVILRRGGEAGTCTAAWLEALGRVLSVALQCGAGQEQLGRTLQGIRCPGRCAGEHQASCLDAIGKMLKMEHPTERSKP